MLLIEASCHPFLSLALLLPHPSPTVQCNRIRVCCRGRGQGAMEVWVARQRKNLGRGVCVSVKKIVFREYVLPWKAHLLLPHPSPTPTAQCNQLRVYCRGRGQGAMEVWVAAQEVSSGRVRSCPIFSIIFAAGECRFWAAMNPFAVDCWRRR